MDNTLSEPANSGRLADGLINRLAPKRVLDAACGPGLLVKALRDRQIDAEGINMSAEFVPNGRYDVVISIDDPGLLSGHDGSFLRLLTSATDSILFSGAPARPHSKRTIDWLDLFAAFGFAPEIAFDASFINPHAMLLRRAAPPPRDVTILFAECIDYRYAAAQNSPDLLADLTRYKERASMLEAQLVRERDYLETLRGVHAYLVQDVQRLREAAAHPPASPDSASFESPAKPQPDVWPLLQQNADLRAEILRLERRFTGIERSVQSLADTVDNILQSRIWRTMVSLGGLVLRLSKVLPNRDRQGAVR